MAIQVCVTVMWKKRLFFFHPLYFDVICNLKKPKAFSCSLLVLCVLYPQTNRLALPSYQHVGPFGCGRQGSLKREREGGQRERGRESTLVSTYPSPKDRTEEEEKV